ncbi:unnamed protein product [Paramecium octaurelia]|uniref:Uncharacterized protein n=1 Tax=Paramecium octaurelia TaxID=43137 RepID=A0A8S1XC13_PAROT|nr:unnamed protein product [Paramecium octaurelia]
MLDSDLDEQDKSFLNFNEDLRDIIKPIQLDVQDQIDEKKKNDDQDQDQEEELKKLIWLDEEQHLYCSQCQRRIAEKTRLSHFTSVEHLKIMTKKIQNEKPQLWNYEQAVKFENTIKKRDFKQMWQEIKKYFSDQLLKSQITQDCKQNQQQALLKELSNFFYYLLMNDVRVINTFIIIYHYNCQSKQFEFNMPPKFMRYQYITY